jgi:hypothetical protein
MPERPKHHMMIMIAFCLAAVLLVTYSIALIIAAHGMAPVGLFLVVWNGVEWVPGQLLGWASIIGLVAVTIGFRHDALKLAIGQLVASIFLYLSWFVFACFATTANAYLGARWNGFWGDLGRQFSTSAPFQFAFLVVAGILIWQIARRHRERRAASSSSSDAS